MEKFTFSDIPSSMKILCSNVSDLIKGLFKQAKLVEGSLIFDSRTDPKESQLL